MNKFFTYAIIFAVAAIVNPLIHSLFKPLQQLEFSAMAIGLLSSIAFYLLMLTLAQFLIIINESQPIEYLPASIDEYPSLNWEPLERYTFEWMGEYHRSKN